MINHRSSADGDHVVTGEEWRLETGPWNQAGCLRIAIDRMGDDNNVLSIFMIELEP